MPGGYQVQVQDLCLYPGAIGSATVAIKNINKNNNDRNRVTLGLEIQSLRLGFNLRLPGFYFGLDSRLARLYFGLLWT